jgi:hypothetical protein
VSAQHPLLPQKAAAYRIGSFCFFFEKEALPLVLSSKKSTKKPSFFIRPIRLYRRHG